MTVKKYTDQTKIARATTLYSIKPKDKPPPYINSMDVIYRIVKFGL